MGEGRERKREREGEKNRKGMREGKRTKEIERGQPIMAFVRVSPW